DSVKEEIQAEWAPKLGLMDGWVAYPCTPMQAGMIVATLKDHTSYLMCDVFKAVAPVNLMKLQTAFNVVLTMNDVLRANFASTSAGVIQIIRSADQLVDIEIVHTSVEDCLDSERDRGFSMEDRTWIRLTLVKPSEAEEYVVLTIHHALYDGWCLQEIVDDLFAYPTLTMSTTSNNSAIKRIARQAGVTAATVLKAAWVLTLWKYQRTDDVSFGFVSAGRDIPVPDAERIIGPLLATLLCRISMDKDLTAVEFLKAIQNDHVEMIPHSTSSLTDVKKWSGVDGLSDLFDTLFVVENIPLSMSDGSNSEPAHFRQYTNSDANAKSVAYKFEMLLFPGESSWTINGLYDGVYVDRDYARAVIEEFDYVLSELCLNGERSLVSNFVDLSLSQKRTIYNFSQGDVRPLPFECVHYGFEQLVDVDASVIAVEQNDKSLTYGELNDLAESLANELAELGACVGKRVAIVMQR
ncbi:hypothetical protein HDV05_000786, partial [Chytridiales sp. JEL 0842]